MTDIGLLNVAIALAIGLVIWRTAAWAIRLLATPPPEVDPEDTVAVEQAYRCTVCGTEVTMTVQNLREATAPRHCREDMIPIWRPDQR